MFIVFICSFLRSHYTFIMFTTNFREKLKAQSLYMNKILVFIMVYTCSMSLNDGGAVLESDDCFKLLGKPVLYFYMF